MLPSASTYLQISAKAQGAKTSAAHQQMARAHWMDARLAREKTIALQWIKTPGGGVEDRPTPSGSTNRPGAQPPRGGKKGPRGSAPPPPARFAATKGCNTCR